MKTPMRIAVPVAAALLLAAAIQGRAQIQAQPPSEPQQPAAAQEQRGGSSSPLQQTLVPGLATYTDDVLYGDVWRRTELSARDRSLVTISVLIATGRSAQLVGHLGRALSNGVRPSEASGVLTHLAIYCGWPSAVTALDVYEQVYTARKVDTAALRAAVTPLPAPADSARARAMTEPYATVAPKFTQLTNDVVFDNLWRRSDLSLRDRSLVTISALAAMGDDDQLDFYLRRGVESGLTREQIGEAFTHLAFYAGWSKATKAMTTMARTLGQIAATAAQMATMPANRAAAPETPSASSNFTGSVSVTQPFRGSGGARLGGATVTFQPGARTKWHIHPLGQLLVVTAGRAWVQIEGEQVRALGPGEVVWTPPGAKHWHGATRSSSMTHVGVSESEEGSPVTWLEPVSDAQYQGPRN
jgi:4-carboxymuconolactone decarboxylase